MGALKKVMERFLGSVFLHELQTSSNVGPNQFAYVPHRGCRDALAVLEFNWILALEHDMRIGVYCSDVSGAFDRVNTERLTLTLQTKGICRPTLAVLHSWLSHRSAQVIVEGARSK